MYLCFFMSGQPRDCGQRTMPSWFLIGCGQLAVVWERGLVARLCGLVSAPQEGSVAPCGCPDAYIIAFLVGRGVGSGDL
jgi:hypothetical protein